jgi:hypothetical protein
VGEHLPQGAAIHVVAWRGPGPAAARGVRTALLQGLPVTV